MSYLQKFVVVAVHCGLCLNMEILVSSDVPKVKELLAKCKEHFAMWESVQMDCDEDVIRQDEKNASLWTLARVGSDRLAWDQDRWRFFSKFISKSRGSTEDFNVHVSESVFAAKRYIGVRWKQRKSTSLEYEGRDFSWLEFNSSNVSIETYDETTLAERPRQYDPSRIEVLTGRRTIVFDPKTIVDYFPAEANCVVSSCVLLGQDCWQVKTTRNLGDGTYTIVICPGLGYAPLEFTSSRTARDLNYDQKKIGDLVDQSGRRAKSYDHVTRIEAVTPDWSEFTIRTIDWAVHEGGFNDGLGVVRRYYNVVRPAPENAFQLQAEIPNGTSVALRDSPQLKAEWHDGKIVRVYDGEAVKELATIEMKPARSGWGKVFLLGIVLAGLTGFGWRYLRQGRITANHRGPMRK
jgi:hypothetical protein